MASTVSFPSRTFHNFLLPPSEDGATATDHFSTDDLSASSLQGYSLFSTNSLVDQSTESHHHHLAAETSETKTAASNGRPKIMTKFRARSNNKTGDLATSGNDEEYCKTIETSEKTAPAYDDDLVVNVEEQTLAVATTEFIKVETSEKRKTASNSGSQPATIKIKLDRKCMKKTKDHETLVATYSKVEEEKKKKRIFSVSLTKEEIEEDMIAVGLHGLKRSRKIKKRPKSVQKLLDNLFPGLHLKSIALDDYRVS